MAVAGIGAAIASLVTVIGMWLTFKQRSDDSLDRRNRDLVNDNAALRVRVKDLEDEVLNLLRHVVNSKQD